MQTNTKPLTNKKQKLTKIGMTKKTKNGKESKIGDYDFKISDDQ